MSRGTRYGCNESLSLLLASLQAASCGAWALRLVIVVIVVIGKMTVGAPIMKSSGSSTGYEAALASGIGAAARVCPQPRLCSYCFKSFISWEFYLIDRFDFHHLLLLKDFYS